MKADINRPEVKDLGIAIAKEVTEEAEDWFVFLINFKDIPIHNVIVSSKGYGEKEGKKIKTSVLRHFFEIVPPHSYVKIEMIPENLLALGNEFLVSFYIGSLIHDKKYIFVPGSIRTSNQVDIPILHKRGVLIK